MDVDDVATDFPELIILCSHAAFPWVWEIVAICARHPNVYIETTGIDTYYTALGGQSPYVEAANSVLGDQFVFASAKPYMPLKMSVESIQRLPFKKEVMKKILYDNAARILKL